MSRPGVTIDETMTARMAGLARLNLTADEARAYTAQLAQVVKHVEQLQAVDVEGVEPLYSPWPLETPLREDAARAFPRAADGRPATLASAPQAQDGGFRVPSIL
jgi:aspartyl-tRNA(Asn)/glutamyl-tRNA(Gln) amidotransferase subunit C